MCVEGYHRIRPLRRFHAHCWNERNVSMFEVWCLAIRGWWQIVTFRGWILLSDLETWLCYSACCWVVSKQDCSNCDPCTFFCCWFIMYSILRRMELGEVESNTGWLQLSSMTASSAPALVIAATVSFSIDSIFTDASNLASSFSFQWTYDVPWQFQI